MNAFLDNAGAMIDFLEANSEVKFNFGKNYPDYHPDHPGGAEEGRSNFTARPFASTRATGSYLRPAAFRTMRTARGVISNICKPAPRTPR